MHETALMKNLITTIEQALKGRNVMRVNCVYISVGKLSNALPDALSFAFEALTQDGFLKGAKLVIENLPAVARCEDCGQEYHADRFPIVCPACSSTSFIIISGEEVYIQSIDCEEKCLND
jgi:hydrogenase nickel incorporation protein HypA/HybF